MRPVRLPGLLAYAAMAMWLLQILISPAGAAVVAARLGDHLDEIAAALAVKGAPPEAKITLAAPEATISIEEGTSLLFDSASFNPATGRFLLRAQSASGVVAVTGTAIATLMLPVAARDIARNEILVETDFDWIERADVRAAQYIDDADLIVGKAARRPLAAGAPFRKADLQAPTLIKRGATATIVLEGPGLRLTQAAVALANGAAGDLIAFRNVNSDREFKAVVVAKDRARAPFRASFASLEQ